MGLESRAKLEARLRNLEGRELGRSAGSAEGKPKIEFYDKDRKKGGGAMITTAKVYNTSADSLPGWVEPVAKKEEQMAPLTTRNEAEPSLTVEATIGEKKEKTKKEVADAENAGLPNVEASHMEPESEGKKERQEKKKKHSDENADIQTEDENGAKKKSKRKHAETEGKQTEASTKKEKKKKKGSED